MKSQFISLLLFVSAFTPAVVGAANPSVLFLSPVGGTFYKGDIFSVDVFVDTQGQNVNAVASYISYPEGILQPVSIDTVGSTMEFVVERNYGGGRIEISGGTPTPGFNGVYKIASVKFQPLTAGKANLSFFEDSAVLLDRGNQNIFRGGENVTYEIKDVLRQQQQDQQEQMPQSSPKYVYENPLRTFLSHSLLSSLTGSADMLNSLFSFINSFFE